MKKLLLTLLSTLLSVTLASAESSPQDLAQWKTWILQRHPEWKCAKDSNGAMQCVFPGKVSFEIKSTGAKFTLQAELLTDGLLPIPGNGELPPTGITVSSGDKQNISAKVVLNGGEIFLSLPAGSFTVSGELNWGAVPSEIPLNSTTGLVEIKNQPNSEILRSASGFRFLERSSETERNSLQIRVFRKFEDGSPLESLSVIQFRVGGVARPLQLGQVIPENSTPISIQSPLNFQLTKEGELTVELTPGEHEVRVRTISAQPVTSIKVKKPKNEDWPSEEYWVWSPRPELRTMEIIDGKPVSASVINLPRDFGSETAYAIDGSELNLNEITRGEDQRLPDSINISREFWLDLDGKGFSIKDVLSGTASTSMRIDAQSELELGRVTENQGSALVTLSNGAKGVEIRDTNVNLQAISRLPNDGDFSATGWNVDTANSVSIQLHLPPSWELLNVTGGTSGFNSWMESWTLLHIFILALLVIASYKLFGTQLAVLFFLSVLLNHAQHLEPKMLFIHLFALFGLKKFFKHLSGSWRAVVSTLTLITFATLTLEQLSFAKLQFTQFLFPQLPAGTRHRTALQSLFILNEENLLVWPGILFVVGLAIFLLRWTFKELDVWKVIGRLIVSSVVGSIGIAIITGIIAASTLGRGTVASSRNYDYLEASKGDLAAPVEEQAAYGREANSGEATSGEGSFDANMPQSIAKDSRQNSSPVMRMKKIRAVSVANTNVVAGPTLPNWNWKSAYVTVQGPVAKDAKVNLWLMPPSVTRILCGLRSILALLLSYFLFRGLGYSMRFNSTGLNTTGMSSVGISSIVALLLLVPASAKADFPSEALLQELEAHMAKEQCQTLPCSQIKELVISLDKGLLNLKIKASSLGRTTVFIPGPIENFSPTQVTVNQKPTSQMRRNPNGFLEIALDEGDSLIELEGPISTSQTFSLQFAAKPLFTKVDLRDFAVEGLSKEGTVEQGLRFVKKDEGSQTKLTESVVLPNWTVVTREINISQVISVSTTVTRLGNASSSFSVSVPLLPSEQVTTGVGVASENALALTFPPQVSVLSYESLLPFNQDLSFVAKDTPQLSEKWAVNCASHFSCSTGGILPTSSVTGTIKNTTWHPFPTETATVHVEQLKTLSGDFIAIDSVTNTASFSDSMNQGSLRIGARATQQANLKLQSPEGIEIKQVTLDGRAINYSRLEFLLAPGSHVLTLDYTFQNHSKFISAVPRFSILPLAQNISTNARPNLERWLLWSYGDGWGPSVLYWSKLIFVIALCMALSHFGILGISLLSAALLGIGISSLPLALTIFPLGWLIWLQVPNTLVERYTLGKQWLKITVTAVFAVISFVLLYEVVQIGLVLNPPMLIVGNNSSAEYLKWFVDHSGEMLPKAKFISVPMWVWRGFSLVWSLWLVGSLIRWIKRSTAKCLG